MIKVGSLVRLAKYSQDTKRQNWVDWFFDVAKDVPAKVVRIGDEFCDVEFVRPVVAIESGRKLTYDKLYGHSLYMFEEINQTEKSTEYED